MNDRLQTSIFSHPGAAVAAFGVFALDPGKATLHVANAKAQESILCVRGVDAPRNCGVGVRKSCSWGYSLQDGSCGVHNEMGIYSEIPEY